MSLPQRAFLPQQAQRHLSDLRPSPFCCPLEELAHLTHVPLGFSLRSEGSRAPHCAKMVPPQIPPTKPQASSFRHKPAFDPHTTVPGRPHLASRTLPPALLQVVPAQKRHTKLVPRAPRLRSHPPAPAPAGQCRSSSPARLASPAFLPQSQSCLPGR